MSTSTDKSGKKTSNSPPKQKLGDTPVPPWEMPTPEEKEAAKPVRQALKEAIKEVDSQKKADEVIQNLEVATAGKTAREMKQTQAPVESPDEAAQDVQYAAKAVPKRERTEKILEETARVIAAAPRIALAAGYDVEAALE